ncbi:MAG: bifunctional diguanylate cyclase/phosphodiesterase [Treponema sp.]|nr:bifunctional diguanylate cyclase/phosphodiesterase [Treponema sp.]
MKNPLRFVSYLLIAVASVGITHGLFRISANYFDSVGKNDDSSDFQSLSDKKVLYISSYNNTFDNVGQQVRGLKSVFDPANIALDVQFMDMLNFDSKSNLDIFYKTLQIKFSRKDSYDAVVLGDDFALSFAFDHEKEFFNDIPLVFTGVNDGRLAALAEQNQNATGFISDKSIRGTVEIAMKLYPKAKVIYAVYDDSTMGIERQSDFFSLRQNYSGYLFRGVDASEYSRESLGKILDVIEEDNLVICLGVSEDNDGNWYSSTETTEFLATHTKAPVFSDNFSSVGKGFVGGKIINEEKMAKAAAEVVKDIVEGDVDIKNLHVSRFEPEYYFDSELLKKFGMKKKVLSSAILLNKKYDYWQKYFPILSPVIEIFVSLLVFFVVLFTCIVEIYKSHRENAFSTKHDLLTGLYNRYAILSRIGLAIKSGKKFSVIQIDVDDFRSINDFNSYKCGDAILKELALRIKSLCKDGKYEAARFDGDSFLLIFKGGNLSQNAPEIYFLKQFLENAIVFEEKTFLIRTTGGIVNSRPEFDVDDYLSNVDIAIHFAKRQGKSRFLIFDDEMKNEVLKISKIGNLLENACKNEDFNVLYQPQIDAKTGKVCGYEALVRLPNSDISPSVFIPIAERDGHIAKIGRIVTEKVVRQLAEWRKSGRELHRVSINFSVAQLEDKNYIPFLSKLMRTYEIPPELIVIEITESFLLKDRIRALELFGQFSSLGIKVAIDDFGTGYSSLNYLGYLPVCAVKLDKSTVDAYLDGKPEFIENIVRLVHSLGMKLTVEGVEEKWQYDKLKLFGCDFIQGYFFSKPLSYEDLKTFVPKTE